MNIRTNCLHIVVLMAVVCALWAPPTPVAACSGYGPGAQPPTITERTIAATVVLVGKVIATRNDVPGLYAATLEIQLSIKGVDHLRGRLLVTINGFGSPSLCKSAVAVGETWLFFAKVNTLGQLYAQYLAVWDATAPADAAVIVEAAAAAGVGQRLWLPLVSTGAA